MSYRTPAQLCGRLVHLSVTQKQFFARSIPCRTSNHARRFGTEPRPFLRQHLLRSAAVQKFKLACKVSFNIAVVWLVAFLIFAEREDPDSAAERNKLVIAGVSRTRDLVISKDPNLTHIDTAVHHYCALLAAFYGPVSPSTNWADFTKGLFHHLEQNPQDHTQFHDITRAVCAKVQAEISRIEDPSRVPRNLLADVVARVHFCMSRSMVELSEFVLQARWGPNPYIPSQKKSGKETTRLYEPVESR